MEPPSTTMDWAPQPVRCEPLRGSRERPLPHLARELVDPVSDFLGPSAPPPRSPDFDVLDTFVDLLAREGEGIGRRLVDGLMADGVSAERILLGLLTPAAQRLGQRWEDDTASFFEVTVATGHLQELLRRVEAAAPSGYDGTDAPGVLLLTPKGDDHTFGALLFQAVLRLRGWAVVPRPPFMERMEGPLGRDRLAVLGVSIGSRRSLKTARGLIARARRIAANPKLVVLAGGPLIAVDPEAAQELDADGAAGDAESALDLLRDLVPRDLQPRSASA
jgi:methanogenic corrinoid protein MtbC1